MGDDLPNLSYVALDAAPSALIWDGGLFFVPIHAVSEISLDQTYHFPAIGGSGFRAAAPVADSMVRLRGVLAGPLRQTQKAMLEMAAEAAQRGGVMSGLTGLLAGATGLASLQAGGLLLVTRLTIRTDMQIKSLNFTVQAGRRDAIDTTITLEHMPRPNAFIGKALDMVGTVALGALMDAT